MAMKIFSQFPKTRPKLSPAYLKIYKSHYKENREGRTLFSSLSLSAESWEHIQIAKDISKKSNKKSTLEIGAGTLNHLPYEPDIEEYDIIEPQKELYEDSKFLNRISNIYTDICEIPMINKYDRIISCNTFEHICNLPEVVAICGLLLKNNGMLRVGIPSEGTFLWALSWQLTTGLEFRLKYGLSYGLLMKHKHVNTAREVEDVLCYFFNEINYKVCGISKSISLYQFYVCSSPSEKRCVEYLEEASHSKILTNH
jgi:hypothetical protein